MNHDPMRLGAMRTLMAQQQGTPAFIEDVPHALHLLAQSMESAAAISFQLGAGGMKHQTQRAETMRDAAMMVRALQLNVSALLAEVADAQALQAEVDAQDVAQLAEMVEMAESAAEEHLAEVATRAAMAELGKTWAHCTACTDAEWCTPDSSGDLVCSDCLPTWEGGDQ